MSTTIFFTGAVRGGRAHQPQYADIISALEEYGEVFSEHVADDSITQYGETELTKEEIRSRELKALEQSDIVVAEVTTPSLGVGYLIAHATILGKRVIALYNGDDVLKLSAMIKGDSDVTVHTYQTLQDVQKILRTELSD